MWFDGNFWWLGVGMVILMIVFWGGVIALVVWAVLRFTRREADTRANERPTPLEIAKERYAKGEITKDEFDIIKRDLSG